MKRLLFGLAALPFLAGVSLAAQPVPLSDQLMDQVTAGFDFIEVNVQNLGTTFVAANFPPLGGAFCGLDGRCFIAVTGTTFPGNPGSPALPPFSTAPSVQSLQVYANFGP